MGVCSRPTFFRSRDFAPDPAVQALINQIPSPSKINNYRVGDSQPGQLLNTAGYSYLVRAE